MHNTQSEAGDSEFRQVASLEPMSVDLRNRFRASEGQLCSSRQGSVWSGTRPLNDVLERLTQSPPHQYPLPRLPPAASDISKGSRNLNLRTTGQLVGSKGCRSHVAT